MCTQLKAAVEEEQSKTLWVPSVQAWPLPPTPDKKSVTFCTHCQYTNTEYTKNANHSDHDVRYYSDPGRNEIPKLKKKPSIKDKPKKDSDANKKYQGYYSEPDAKYFEIDYEFLKELRRIAKRHCPKCKRKRARREYNQQQKDKKQSRYSKLRDNFVYCNGRYHSASEHCQLCCRVCNNRSSDTVDSNDNDMYSLVSKSYSLPSKKAIPSRSGSNRGARIERKNSIQSIKSVSFLDSNSEESSKHEPNYTAKSFTNDLKQFLLKPATPRLSLKDKFITSLKQEFDAKKKSPKLKAIKGLWKSYWWIKLFKLHFKLYARLSYNIFFFGCNILNLFLLDTLSFKYLCLLSILYSNTTIRAIKHWHHYLDQ